MRRPAPIRRAASAASRAAPVIWLPPDDRMTTPVFVVLELRLRKGIEPQRGRILEGSGINGVKI